MPKTGTGPILPESAGAPLFILIISDTSMRVQQVSDRYRYTFISAPALIDYHVIPVRELSQRGEIR